jgi:TM2 domain-containing membrane protein YozV
MNPIHLGEKREPLTAPDPDHAFPISEKSAAVAVFLSMVIPGLGQIYVKRVKRGIVIFLCFVLFFFIGGAFALSLALFLHFLMNLFFLVIVIIWGLNLLDAYRCATQFNVKIREDIYKEVIALAARAPKLNPIYMKGQAGNSGITSVPEDGTLLDQPSRLGPASMKSCPNCGQVIPLSGAVFCPECGAKIQ